ncbi:MAG: 30S ribosomal protein S17 [Candidatus Aenigmatarchaeota archaeon]
MALTKKKKEERKHANIGIDAKPPKGTCKDKKCPWHGSLSLRGRIIRGIVRSAKASKTAVVEWRFVHYLPKYERYERRKGRVVAYNPQCISAKVGDKVKVVECRSLSKTKSFVVIEVGK